MKLLALAPLGLCSAGSVQQVLEQAFANVYQPTPAGFKLSFEPHFSADVFYKLDGKAMGVQGHYAGVNFESKLLPNNCKWIVNKSGKFWNNPITHSVFGAESVHWNGMDFESHQHLTWCDGSGLEYLHKGHFNNAKFSHTAALSLDSIQSTAKGMSGRMTFENEGQVAPNFPMAEFAGESMSLKVVTDAGMRPSCVNNPFDAQCKIDVDVETKYNGESMPKFEVDWRAKQGDFSAKLGGKMVFRLNFNYGPYWTVAWMCPSLGYNSMTHLITLPSVDTLTTAVLDEGIEFFQPFMALFTLSTESARDTIRAMVYMDRLIAALAPRDIFDCSEIVTASGFEMPLLASHLGAPTVQEYAQNWCASNNDNVEQFLVEEVSPKVKEGRQFLRYVVSDAGRADYKEWEARVMAY